MKSGVKEHPDDVFFKICIVGNAGVGKTSLLKRFVSDVFEDEVTIDIPHEVKRITVDDTPVKLQIWDTAGHERFRTITWSYYGGSRGVMVAFDVTNLQSFEEVPNWVIDVQRYVKREVPIILVGTKVDLINKRMITADEARSVAQKLNIPYLETSAKMSSGVNVAFTTLASEVMKLDTLQKQSQQPSIKTNSNSCCVIL